MAFVGCLHGISMKLAWRWHGAGIAWRQYGINVALAWRWCSVSVALVWP